MVEDEVFRKYTGRRVRGYCLKSIPDTGTLLVFDDWWNTGYLEASLDAKRNSLVIQELEAFATEEYLEGLACSLSIYLNNAGFYNGFEVNLNTPAAMLTPAIRQALINDAMDKMFAVR